MSFVFFHLVLLFRVQVHIYKGICVYTYLHTDIYGRRVHKRKCFSFLHLHTYKLLHNSKFFKSILVNQANYFGCDFFIIKFFGKFSSIISNIYCGHIYLYSLSSNFPYSLFAKYKYIRLYTYIFTFPVSRTERSFFLCVLFFGQSLRECNIWN